MKNKRLLNKIIATSMCVTTLSALCACGEKEGDVEQSISILEDVTEAKDNNEKEIEIKEPEEVESTEEETEDTTEVSVEDMIMDYEPGESEVNFYIPIEGYYGHNTYDVEPDEYMQIPECCMSYNGFDDKLANIIQTEKVCSTWDEFCDKYNEYMLKDATEEEILKIGTTAKAVLRVLNEIPTDVAVAMSTDVYDFKAVVNLIQERYKEGLTDLEMMQTYLDDLVGKCNVDEELCGIKFQTLVEAVKDNYILYMEDAKDELYLTLQAHITILNERGQDLSQYLDVLGQSVDDVSGTVNKAVCEVINDNTYAERIYGMLGKTLIID